MIGGREFDLLYSAQLLSVNFKSTATPKLEKLEYFEVIQAILLA
jgi:hypothetical protein